MKYFAEHTVFRNGNVTSTPGPANCTLTLNYDGMNRLASTTGCGTESYGYGPDGKRVYRSTGGQELVYLYGALGERIGTYVAYVGSSITFNTKEVNLYFGGRVVFTSGANPQYDPWQNVFVDRLGSVVKRGTSTDGSVARWTTLQYRAYGQEKAVTEQDRDKFATYLRDGVTGLDYAQQRYYSSTMGRFLSADPYEGEAASVNNRSEPGSWNKYVYVLGDPANGTDMSGLGEGVTTCDLYKYAPGCSLLPTCSVFPNHPVCRQSRQKLQRQPTDEERALEAAVMRSTDLLANLHCAGLFLEPDANTPVNRQALSRKMQDAFRDGSFKVIVETALYPGTKADVPAFTTSTFGIMYFISGRSFFTGLTPDGQPLGGAMSGLSLSSAQDLMVTHEFMHWMGIVGLDTKGETYTLPNGQSVAGTLGISQAVRDNCIR